MFFGVNEMKLISLIGILIVIFVLELKQTTLWKEKKPKINDVKICIRLFEMSDTNSREFRLQSNFEKTSAERHESTKYLKTSSITVIVTGNVS